MLGERIAYARKRKGWTLRDLERCSGVAKSNLSRIENGTQEPTFLAVCMLCRVLRLSIARLAAAEITASKGRG